MGTGDEWKLFSFTDSSHLQHRAHINLNNLFSPRNANVSLIQAN